MKKNNILFRLTFMITAAVMLLLTAQPFAACADSDKQYYVMSADFTANLLENGDAIIYEEWLVNYTKGDFTRFYKDINDPQNQLEYFDNIEVISCSINDDEAAAQYNTDRNDNHYYLESGSENYTIHWFKHAHNEMVKYTIGYKIKNAVKLNKDNRAEFCYRFIGKNFSTNVNSVNATIVTPNSDSSMTVTVSKGSSETAGNAVNLQAENVSGMYKVRMNMDSSGFDGLRRIVDIDLPSYSEYEGNSRGIGSTDDDGFQFSDILAVILIALFVIVFQAFPFNIIIGIILFLVIKNSINKRKIKKDPECLDRAADRLDSLEVPHVWALLLPKLRKTLSSPFTNFYLCLCDLSKKGRIKLTDDGILIYNKPLRDTYDYFQKEMDDSYLEFLKEQFHSDATEEGQLIKFQYIKERLGDTNSFYEFRKGDSQWLITYSKNISSSTLYQDLAASGQLEQVKHDFAAWKKYAYYAKAASNPYDCLTVLKRTGAVNSYLALSLINNRESQTDLVNGPDRTAAPDLYNLVFFLTYTAIPHDTSHRPTSDSGHSCSSCSSCSSCGGGGAD